MRLTEVDHRREQGWVRLAPPPDPSAGPHVLSHIPGTDDRVIAHDRGLTRVDDAGRPRWRYTCAGRPRETHVSGDRLLVTTDALDYDAAWGILGPALLFDLTDSALVAELRGDCGAAVDGGRFLLGLEGYDIFGTWLHERDGTVLETWRSCGHHVVDPDGGVRVVECDRRHPTRSRVVRLLPGGAIEPGPRLPHGLVPRPVVLGDGTIVLLDAGVLRAVDCRLRDVELAELLPLPPEEAWRFFGELALDGDRLTVAIAERGQDDPSVYETHCWTFALTR